MLRTNNLSLLGLVRAIVPMIIVFSWDTFINNPFGLYGIWPNLDVPMHVLGGFVTMWSITRVLALLPKSWQPVIRPALANYFFWLGLVAMVTIAWEIYELIFDFFHPFPTPMTVADTLGDMVNGLIGANIWLFVQHYVKRTRPTRQVVQGRKSRRRKQTGDQIFESR